MARHFYNPKERAEVVFPSQVERLIILVSSYYDAVKGAQDSARMKRRKRNEA